MTTIALLKIKGVDGRKWRHRGKGESKQTGAPFAPDPRAMKKALKRQPGHLDHIGCNWRLRPREHADLSHPIRNTHEGLLTACV